MPVIYHVNDFKLLCPTYNMVAHGEACERCHGGRFWRAVTQGCYYGGAARSVVLAAEAYLHKWIHTYANCVDRFLAPSEFVKRKLIENGLDGTRIDVLPHFQRVPEGAPDQPDREAPILYFGRLSAEKGVADLVRAAQRVPGVRLQIAGDGPERAALEALASSIAANNVEFLGHVATGDLDQLIQGCRFTVFPSRAYETFGKAILESYAHARAVIASDMGSRRELVQEGLTGMLFRPGDVDQLAAAISFLSERPDIARQMGAAGRELVRVRYSPEDHCRALTALYDGLRTPHKSPKSTRPAKLKVAFIGGRGVGAKYSGIEAYYEQVGRALTSRGHEVTAYSRTYFTPKLNDYEGVKIVRLPTVPSKHLDTLLHTLLSTVHVLFTDCNIVHYHALGPSLFSFVPRLLGKRTVVTVQGLDWQRKKWGRFAAATLRLGELASAWLPNETMVVSQTLRKYYRARHGIDPTYIPNGTVVRTQRRPERITDLGLTARNYILFLGRFSPEKNCDLLIDAYRRIDTPVKLVLAGGSSHTDDYARKLRAHQSGRIRLLDYVSGDMLDELLTNAMLFVLPSDLEGMSLALLDAMGAGVCVLASDIAENRELVEGAGFTFRTGDVADLERMLRLLIADAHTRETAARLAQEKVKQHYLWPAVAEQIENVYWNLLGWSSSNRQPVSADAAQPQPSVEPAA